MTRHRFTLLVVLRDSAACVFDERMAFALSGRSKGAIDSLSAKLDNLSVALRTLQTW